MCQRLNKGLYRQACFAVVLKYCAYATWSPEVVEIKCKITTSYTVIFCRHLAFAAKVFLRVFLSCFLFFILFFGWHTEHRTQDKDSWQDTSILKFSRNFTYFVQIRSNMPHNKRASKQTEQFFFSLPSFCTFLPSYFRPNLSPFLSGDCCQFLRKIKFYLFIHYCINASVRRLGNAISFQ